MARRIILAVFCGALCLSEAKRQLDSEAEHTLDSEDSLLNITANSTEVESPLVTGIPFIDRLLGSFPGLGAAPPQPPPPPQIPYPAGVARPHPAVDGNIMQESHYWVFAKQVPLQPGIGSIAWHHEVMFCLRHVNANPAQINAVIQQDLQASNMPLGQHYMNKQSLFVLNNMLPQCFTATFGASRGSFLAGGEFGTIDENVYGHSPFSVHIIYVGFAMNVALYPYVLVMTECGNYGQGEYLLFNNNCNYYTRALLLGLHLPIHFQTNSIFESQMLQDIGRYDIRMGQCAGMKCTRWAPKKCVAHCTWRGPGQCI